MDTVKAVIDVGTNSIKFHAAKKKADGSLETVLDKNDIARLGEGLRETGLIAPEALERNALSVAAFAEKAKELGAVPEIVGTMALRTAKNAADFASRVKELTGLDVRIIPGEEEARLSYLAVLSGLPLAGGSSSPSIRAAEVRNSSTARVRRWCGSSAYPWGRCASPRNSSPTTRFVRARWTLR